MSFQTPHIWCFFVLRCLIYKVHAPTAEHVIDYHVARELSTPFLHFFGFSQKYFEHTHMIIQFAQKYKGKFIDKPLEKNGKGA